MPVTEGPLNNNNENYEMSGSAMLLHAEEASIQWMSIDDFRFKREVRAALRDEVSTMRSQGIDADIILQRTLDELNSFSANYIDRLEKYENYFESEDFNIDDVPELVLQEVALELGIDIDDIHPSWLALGNRVADRIDSSDSLLNNMNIEIVRMYRVSSGTNGKLFLTEPMVEDFFDMGFIDQVEYVYSRNRILSEMQQSLDIPNIESQVFGEAENFSEEDLAKAAYLEQNILTSEHPEAQLSEADALLVAQTTTNPDVLAVLRSFPESPDVTRAIVTNPAVTREILISIANSPRLEERAELALNTDYKEVLLMLCSDVDEIKLLIATERVDYPDYPELAEELFWSTFGTDNVNSDIPDNIIANLLFRSTNRGGIDNLVIDHMTELPEPILIVLAQNCGDRDTLDRLAISTTNWNILREVVGNRNTRLETQQAILAGELGQS